MSHYIPPKGIPVLDYALGPNVTLTRSQTVDRIIELERANKRLADRVELWQRIALAAIVIAAVSQGGFLFLSIWYGS